MPKIAINYLTREVSFYKFICNNPEIKSIYVGHTVNFTMRKSKHKSCCNNNPSNKEYNFKLYQTIRENGGWNEWKMIEIERRFIKDKREGDRIEQEWIEKLQADMNSMRAFGIDKNAFKEYQKNWCIENADAIKEQKKEYRLKNAEAIAKNKKRYNSEKADEIREQKKEYYLKNRERILERCKEYYFKKQQST